MKMAIVKWSVDSLVQSQQNPPQGFFTELVENNAKIDTEALNTPDL